jgi:hypothetical protein
MAMRPSYDWERAFTAVILETDRSKLKGRIDAAQAAIDRRLQEMGADHGGSPEERVEIATAQASLEGFRKRVAMPQDFLREKE